MYVYVICILYNMARRDKKCFKKVFFFSFAVETFHVARQVSFSKIKISTIHSICAFLCFRFFVYFQMLGFVA